MTRSHFAMRCAAALGPDRWQSDAPLAPLTTFKVGGSAEWLADIASEDELRTVLADAASAVVPVTILGGGSNVLVADAGIAGVVLRLHFTTIEQVSAGRVRAGAGVTINGLVRWTIGRGLAGLERWAGTPGTVGGAIHGNAHWSGENVGDLVHEVELATNDGEVLTVPADEMGFGYDASRLQHTHEVVVAATFNVTSGDVDALRARARTSLRYRKSTQPLAMPSAGCVFQNPASFDAVPDHIPRSAGALIDRAGLKGRRCGGARISDRHANFVVNEGNATAADVRSLIEAARAAVRDQFAVELRDEIVYLGNF